MAGPSNVRSIRLGSRFQKVLQIGEKARTLPAFNAAEAEIPLERQSDRVDPFSAFQATDLHIGHTVEFWAGTKKIRPVWFHAARVMKRWPVGAELTEAEFDSAITQVQTIRIG